MRYKTGDINNYYNHMKEQAQELLDKQLEIYKVAQTAKLLNDKAKLQKETEEKIKNIDKEISDVHNCTILPNSHINEIASIDWEKVMLSTFVDLKL